MIHSKECRSDVESPGNKQVMESLIQSDKNIMDEADGHAYSSMDDFYEEAHNFNQNAKWKRWRFYIIIASLGIANCGDATEIGSMNYILSSSDFQSDFIQQDFQNRGASIASSIHFGMLIGGVITGAYGDGFMGRRPTLLMGLTINGISGVCSALSINSFMMCFCRFMSGLGVGAVMSSLLTLVTELSPPSYRGFYITIVASFFTIGMIYVSSLAMLLFPLKYSWRLYACLCALPCVAGCICVFFFVPESPRYLGNQGLYSKSALMANELARSMGYHHRKLSKEDIEIFFQKSGKDTQQNSSPEKKNSAMQRILLLYKKPLLHKSIALHIVWCALCFGSGLCSWITTIFEKMNLSNVYFLSFMFSIANIPGNIMASFLMDRMGRKPLLISSMCVASLCLCFFARAAENTSSSQQVVLFFACTFRTFFVMGWCCISCLTSEVFPTSVRSTALGMCSATGRIAGMMVQYVNGALISAGLTREVLLLASAVIFVGSLSPILFGIQESKSQHLKDTIDHDEDISESISGKKT